MLKFLATTENTKLLTSEEPIDKRGKVVGKCSAKLLFAISRHINTQEIVSLTLEPMVTRLIFL